MAFHGGRFMLLLARGAPVAKGAARSQTRRFSPLAWYNKQLDKSPIITKSITSGGDVIGQFILPEESGKMNYARVGRAAIFGCFILGPLAHLHFNFLEYLVIKRWAFTGTKMAFTKMFFDQFTYWAAGINCIYLFSLPKLEGKSNEEALDNVKKRIIPTLKANWCLWPLVQILNFKLVPVPHQLNVVLIVSLGWASYLSWAGGQMAKRQLEKE